MIQANVAAAEALEAAKSPLLYRIHDAPTEEKVKALAEFLATLGLNLPKAGLMQPSQFNRILDKTKDSEITELVNEVILRSQAQAEYSAAQSRPFRPQSAPLCAFHLADPPLCRPDRASRADPHR